MEQLPILDTSYLETVAVEGDFSSLIDYLHLDEIAYNPDTKSLIK
jgi:hypothetical protein